MSTTTADPLATTPDAPEQQAAPPPPILTRNTYPPGQPTIGPAPKALGKTPTSINQIMFPAGGKATHYAGPLVSGPMPGIQGAAGSALLTLTLQVDGSMGNFSLPVQFPGGCFIENVTAFTYATGFPGTGFSIALGSQQSATDIATMVPPAKGAYQAPVAPSAQLPLWDAVSPLSPFQAWLTVAGNTASAGGAIVVVQYVRLAAPWSPGS